MTKRMRRIFKRIRAIGRRKKNRMTYVTNDYLGYDGWTKVLYDLILEEKEETDPAELERIRYQKMVVTTKMILETGR